MGGLAGGGRVAAFSLALLVCVVAALATKEGFQEVTDHKDLKKLMKTKNNLMVVLSEAKLDGKTQEMLTKVRLEDAGLFFDNQILKLQLILIPQVSKSTRGKGTLVKVNCKEAAKLCKKLKVTWKGNSKLILRHYKDGEFHKDYDRPMVRELMSCP